MSSKRYRQAAEQVDQSKTYPFEDALKIVKQFPPVKFDETVELAASMNVDAKKSDQAIRGTLMLPHGTGKSRKVLVFCKGEQEIQAKQAGADYAGGAEFIEKVQGGWLDFDVVVASPDMMRDVSRLGKILGPRGLMPNPKTGTVTPDVAKAVEEIKKGKVEFRMDKLSNIHLVIGKRSFETDKLLENGRTVLAAIAQARPATAKGRLINTLSVSSTMSPSVGVRVDDLEK